VCFCRSVPSLSLPSPYERVCAMLQCVAVRCTELQCGVVCSMLQRATVCCSVLQCAFAIGVRSLSLPSPNCCEVAVCCRVSLFQITPESPKHTFMQCVALCCSMLQCVAVRCSACASKSAAPDYPRCSVLQCVAVCCSVLKCVAVYFCYR